MKDFNKRKLLNHNNEIMSRSNGWFKSDSDESEIIFLYNAGRPGNP